MLARPLLSICALCAYALVLTAAKAEDDHFSTRNTTTSNTTVTVHPTQDDDHNGAGGGSSGTVGFTVQLTGTSVPPGGPLGGQSESIALGISTGGTSSGVSFSAPAADPSKGPFLTSIPPTTGTKYGVVTLTNTSGAPLTLTATPDVEKLSGASQNTFATYVPAHGQPCAAGRIVPPGGSCVVGVQYIAKTTDVSSGQVVAQDSGAVTTHQNSATFNAN